jgi:hypothetical protein
MISACRIGCVLRFCAKKRFDFFKDGTVQTVANQLRELSGRPLNGEMLGSIRERQSGTEV